MPDVNVLIALMDPYHLHHDAAHRWFEAESAGGWASSPLTQIGYVRIVSQRTYPNRIEISQAHAILSAFTRHPAHRFWANDISLLDTARFDAANFLGPKHITDTYLLALAKAKGGRLVTFDRRVNTIAVIDGADFLELIE